MMAYIEKVAQRERLKKNQLDDVIGYCHEEDLTRLIPVLEGKHLVRLQDFS
jgi:phosphosulfolactate phosphohydrolase-like enzyme